MEWSGVGLGAQGAEVGNGACAAACRPQQGHRGGAGSPQEGRVRPWEGGLVEEQGEGPAQEGPCASRPARHRPQRRLTLSRLQQVAAPAQPHLQAHHQPLAQRVDGGVGDLRGRPGGGGNVQRCVQATAPARAPMHWVPARPPCLAQWTLGTGCPAPMQGSAWRERAGCPAACNPGHSAAEAPFSNQPAAAHAPGQSAA